jgi:uncharacterized membrane protein YdjX (TVP38/TMEM64 family)
LEKSKKQKLIIYVFVIAAFVSVLIYAGIRFGPQITDLASKPQELKDLLNSFGWRGILIFIGIQVLQVVVAAIPGEIVQIAGGYVYGTITGTLYSLAGIVTGSVLVFYIARLIGYPVVKLFVTPKQLDKFSFMMNSQKSEAAMFILFLIPGIPKDILTYIAGITPVKPVKFFVIITIGRLPALLGSSLIGHSTQKGEYGLALSISVVAVILFAAGLIFRNRIIDWTSKLIKSKEKIGDPENKRSRE